MTESNRRTKIVATLGPASHSRAMVEALVREGVDVFRVNFSHGSPDEHRQYCQLVREVSNGFGRHIGILQDLRGVKIRTTTCRNGAVLLSEGESVLISGGDDESRPGRLFISPTAVLAELDAGHRVLMDDGRIRLTADAKEEDGWRCRVDVGGKVIDRRGVNLPDTPTASLPSLTEKDLRDLEIGAAAPVDFVALSFVRSPADVETTKDALDELGVNIPVFAKIETPEAVENLGPILEECYGIMVARGDLGVELSPEKVPVEQKRMIARARRGRVPTITATQMLESMIQQPYPTRAEASDVANAVFDGTDAIMLSAETAVGKYPVETVAMAARILREAEAEIVRQRPDRPYLRPRAGISEAEATGDAASLAAASTNARAVVVYTKSGASARLVSGGRPAVPIHVLGNDEGILRRLSVVWGVECSRYGGDPSSLADIVLHSEQIALREGLVESGDRIVIVGGFPFDRPKVTNLIHIHAVP